ncbi:hypothetical protein M0813_14978 [Anaeramoeba flamelloides]|uniref:Uncharacterized protein n=1 Tax=Anaeramoeba flamelloides TaxID=1746091 RepID=A0ABQ8Z3H5_9EUKA|nr:hypothetical protein M0813_14978 [Anaeramoeba flamelloides]
MKQKNNKIAIANKEKTKLGKKEEEESSFSSSTDLTSLSESDEKGLELIPMFSSSEEENEEKSTSTKYALPITIGITPREQKVVIGQLKRELQWLKEKIEILENEERELMGGNKETKGKRSISLSSSNGLVEIIKEPTSFEKLLQDFILQLKNKNSTEEEILKIIKEFESKILDEKQKLKELKTGFLKEERKNRKWKVEYERLKNLNIQLQQRNLKMLNTVQLQLTQTITDSDWLLEYVKQLEKAKMELMFNCKEFLKKEKLNKLQIIRLEKKIFSIQHEKEKTEIIFEKNERILNKYKTEFLSLIEEFKNQKKQIEIKNKEQEKILKEKKAELEKQYEITKKTILNHQSTKNLCQKMEEMEEALKQKIESTNLKTKERNEYLLSLVNQIEMLKKNNEK